MHHHGCMNLLWYESSNGAEKILAPFSDLCQDYNCYNWYWFSSAWYHLAVKVKLRWTQSLQWKNNLRINYILCVFVCSYGEHSRDKFQYSNTQTTKVRGEVKKIKHLTLTPWIRPFIKNVWWENVSCKTWQQQKALFESAEKEENRLKV